MYRFNQLQSENTWKKIQEIPKSKNWTRHAVAIIYVALPSYLQLYVAFALH